jgi:DNA-binding MarR family transcriptional regulator
VRLLRRVRQADAELDLDGPRASLLSILVFAGPQPIGELARMELISQPAVTKMVNALEAGGLVARERSSSDRRVVEVAATAAGRRLLERGRAARVRAVAAILDGMSAEERRAIDRAAAILADRMRRPVARP